MIFETAPVAGATERESKVPWMEAVVEEVAAVVESPPVPIAMPWSEHLLLPDDLNSSDVVYDSAVVAGNIAVDRRHDVALAHTADAGHSDLLQRIAPGFEKIFHRHEHCYYSSDYADRQHQHWDEHGSGCAPSLWFMAVDGWSVVHFAFFIHHSHKVRG